MQIKQEGGKNLPVHSCLEYHIITGRFHVQGKPKIQNGNTCTCQKTGTELTILDTCTNKGERIKRKSILDVRTHLKNTKRKEIFQYEHFFTNSLLGVKNNLLRVTPRLNSFFFTRIYFIKILTLKPANFQNIIRINQRLRFSTRYNNLLI